MKTLLSVLLSSILSFCGVAPAQTSLPITNEGFDFLAVGDGASTASLPGWAWTSGAFTHNPTASTFSLGAPTSYNVAGLNSGASISQVVNTTVTPGKSYVFSVLVGYGTGFGSHPHELTMRVDGVTVVQSEPGVTPPTGGFMATQIAFTHPSYETAASSIEIGIRHTGTGGSLFFDDVKLVEVDKFESLDSGLYSLGDFECFGNGVYINATPICDGWTNGGIAVDRARIVPDGVDMVGPTCGDMPTEGINFCELSNFQTGPDAGAIAPRAELQRLFYAISDEIVFDFEMHTREIIPSGTVYIDTASWSLMDASGPTPVLVDGGVLARTDDDVSINWVASSCTSSIPGTTPFTSRTGRQQARIPVPGALLGRPVILVIAIDNFGDNSVESSVFIDDVRCGQASWRPGTGDGLLLATAGEAGCVSSCGGFAALSGGPGNDVKTMAAGDVLHVSLDDASGTFAFRPILLGGELFVTGTPGPIGFPEYGIHIGFGAFVIIDGSASTPIGTGAAPLVPGGTLHSFQTPTLLAGTSLVIQNLIASPLADNGLIATSDAHLIVFE